MGRASIDWYQDSDGYGDGMGLDGMLACLFFWHILERPGFYTHTQLIWGFGYTHDFVYPRATGEAVLARV